jgi:hypothetical protein
MRLPFVRLGPKTEVASYRILVEVSLTEKETERDSLIALAKNGYEFREFAANKLLGLYSCWGECRYWMLMSAFARQDERAVRRFLDDWVAMDRRPKAQVSKFIPGEHYYALSEKFDTFEEAKNHLSNRGYTYAGLLEKYVPKSEE